VIRRFGNRLRQQNTQTFEIDRILLNYLTVVPLLNGMRSLEQLVSLIEPPTGQQIKCRRFQLPETDMVIQENRKFGDPFKTWEAVRANNSSANRIRWA